MALLYVLTQSIHRLIPFHTQVLVKPTKTRLICAKILIHPKIPILRIPLPYAAQQIGHGHRAILSGVNWQTTTG
jgi:hypothetical protein